MSTPFLRTLIGTAVTQTTANAIASAAYAVNADCLTLDNGTSLGLLADFELQLTWGTAPVAGSVQLLALDWSLDGTTAGAGSTPLSSSLLGRVVGSFNPQFFTSNAVTAMRLRLNSVPLTRKTDFYLFNNGTAQSIPSGSVLSAQIWSPGY